MFENAVNKVCSSIFPIFAVTRPGDAKSTHVVGTGFFIGKAGRFITANHVMSGVPAGTTFWYGGNIPASWLPRMLQIREVFSDPKADLFVGDVPGQQLPPLQVAQSVPKPGKSVCLCGYPLPKVSTSGEAVVTRDIRQYWQPTSVVDFLNASGEGVRFDGFITQHASLRGMSGGPVFDVAGVVFGVDQGCMHRQAVEVRVDNGLVIGVGTIRASIGAVVPLD